MTTIAGTEEQVTLRWYFDVLRERWLVVFAAAVVGLALAMNYLAFAGQQVVAHTIVSVDVIDAGAFDSNEAASRLIDSATEAQLAASFEVASRAVALLDDDITAREVRDNTTVLTVEGATVMDVTYTAASAAAARSGADAVALAYLEYRSEEARERIEAYTDAIEARRAELRTELAASAAELLSHEPDSPLYLQAEVDRAVALQSMSALATQQYQLERVDTTAGSIISPAGENHVQITPARRMILAAGLLGGGLVGAALAFVRNATASRVSTRRQLGSLLFAPDLGALSIGPETSVDFDSRDVRAVRARLLNELPADVSTVVAADVTETAGMSLAPFAVAASLAELGNAVSVVVVGATHRERAQLVEALRLWAVDTVGQHDLQLASHRPSSGADMLVSFASGRGGPLAFESEVEAARTATVDDATATVLTVIVVSGRADEDARIVAFGAAVRAVVFVALGKSQRSAIHSVVDLADRSNCRVVGTVTVRRPSRRRRSKPTP